MESLNPNHNIMQTPAEKTGRLLLTTEEELFNTIIDAKHPFRRLNELLDFETLTHNPCALVTARLEQMALM